MDTARATDDPSLQQATNLYWSRLLAIPAFPMTVIIYWVCTLIRWYNLEAAHTSDPLIAAPYHEWLFRRSIELAVTLVCLLLILYGSHRRWNPRVLLLCGSFVVVIWLYWCYRAVLG